MYYQQILYEIIFVAIELIERGLLPMALKMG